MIRITRLWRWRNIHRPALSAIARPITQITDGEGGDYKNPLAALSRPRGWIVESFRAGIAAI